MFRTDSIASPFPRPALLRGVVAWLLCAFAAPFAKAEAASPEPAVRVTGAAALDALRPEGAGLKLNAASGNALVQFDYAAGAPLDLSASRDLAVRVENDAAAELEIMVTGLSDLTDPNKGRAQTRFFVRAAETTDLRVFLARPRLPKDHPLVQKLGALAAFPGGHQHHWKHVDASALRRVTLRLDWRGAAPGQSVFVGHPRGLGAYDVSSGLLDSLEFPLVDEFGQNRNDTWPGKASSVEELREDARRDLETAASVTRPARSLDTYGGDLDGPSGAATGFFRVGKIDGKWWFFDPEGRLFWSLGVTGAGAGSPTPVKGREALFPATVRNDQDFDPYEANLRRKYGDAWSRDHDAVTAARLRDWGFNTLGAWSRPELVATGRVPYTLITHVGHQGVGRIAKMADPYSESFKTTLDRELAALAASHAEDPRLLGVFIDNELEWGGGYSLAEEVMRAAKSSPARRELVAFLRSRHATPAALNQAWGSDFATHDEVSPRAGLEASPAYQKDLRDFLAGFADAYFSACAAAMRRHFPHHLYLGCRFHVFNPIVTTAASRHCDVISVNAYRPGVADFALATPIDRPCLIGEFHFGVRDAGVWGVGLVAAADTRNQADLVDAYLSDALRNPNIVGAHWFQWSDQVVTGRRDGENFGVGLVTVVDRPSAPLVSAFSSVADALYAYRRAPAPGRIGAPRPPEISRQPVSE